MKHGAQHTLRGMSPIPLQLFSCEHQGLPAVRVALLSRALTAPSLLAAGDSEAVEGNKVPLAAALAFVRVPLQEGGALAVQGDPLSLGPQLVGSLPQQWDTEDQHARLPLRGLLAQRGSLHTCRAKGLCISLSWGQGSGPSQPGHESHALVSILSGKPALLHTEPCRMRQKGPPCLADASTARGTQCSAVLQTGAGDVAASRSKPRPVLSLRSWQGSPQPPELPLLRHRGIKAE